MTIKPNLKVILTALLGFFCANFAKGQLHTGVDVRILSSEYVQTCIGLKPSDQNPQRVDFIVYGDNEIYGMRRSYRLRLGTYKNGEVSWPGYWLNLSSFRYYPAYAFPVINLKERLYSQLYTSGYEAYFLFYNLDDTTQNYERFYYDLVPVAKRTVEVNNNIYFLTGPCDGYDSTGIGYDEFGLDSDSLFLLKYNPKSQETDTAYTFLNGFNRGTDVRNYWGDIALNFEEEQMLLLSDDTLLTYNFGSSTPVSTRAIPPEFFQGHADPTVNMLYDTIYKGISLPAEGYLKPGVDFLGIQRRVLIGDSVHQDTLKFYLPNEARDLELTETSYLSLFGKMKSGYWYGTIRYYANVIDSAQAVLLIKYNADGNVVWYRRYFEDKHYMQVNAIKEGADGSIYIGGAWQEEYYQPLSYWTSGINLIQVPFIMRLDSDGFPITPLNESEIEIYPNPVRYGLRLFTEESSEYRIYDMAGVLQQRGLLNPVKAEQDIVVQQLKDGLYILSVKKLNGSFSMGKFQKTSR